MKKLFKTLPLNDGTNGFRFDYVGFKGVYRKRLLKKRWGITKGKTFWAFHMGKRSVYIEQVKPKRALCDFAHRNWENAYQLVFRVDMSRNH